MTILLISPVSDLPTLLSGSAGADLSKWLAEHKYDVETLFGLEANRVALQAALQRAPTLCIYFGHGDEDTLLGTIPPGNLITADNVEWFAGKIFCTIACLSGQRLAPYAISKGVISYFGATDLLLTAFPEVEHDYLKDFIDVFTIVPRMILSGKNTQEAYDAYIAKCNDYISLYNYSGFASGDWYATALKQNRDVYQLFGKTDARVADATNLIPESDVNLQTILALGAAISLGVGLPLLTAIATQRLMK